MPPPWPAATPKLAQKAQANGPHGQLGRQEGRGTMAATVSFLHSVTRLKTNF